MTEQMISREDAEDLGNAINRLVNEIERFGYSRAMIGSAMIGIGGGIVAAHSGKADCLRVLDGARDALMADGTRQ